MSEGGCIIILSAKGNQMEYGKLVELAKVAFGYETTEQAAISVGKLLYTGSSEEQVEHLANLLFEAIKEAK
jgi:hypothetical protein